MQIVMRKLSELVPNEANPKRHGDNVAKLAKSIEHFGWRQPIVVQKGTNKIAAGHGR